MLYALLCYNNEAAVCGLSKEEDDAMMGRVRAAEEKIVAKSSFGPRLRLMPTTAATFVKAGQDPMVIDGPFAETKEQLLGFYVGDCKSLDQALETARELAAANPGGSYEIRPIGYFAPNGGAAK